MLVIFIIHFRSFHLAFLHSSWGHTKSHRTHSFSMETKADEKPGNECPQNKQKLAKKRKSYTLVTMSNWIGNTHENMSFIVETDLLLEPLAKYEIQRRLVPPISYDAGKEDKKELDIALWDALRKGEQLLTYDGAIGVREQFGRYEDVDIDKFIFIERFC